MDEEQVQEQGLSVEELAEALRQAQGERDSALSKRDAAVGERDTALGERDGLRDQLAASTVRYREALVVSNPGVPPELIAGDSVDALDASLLAARKVVEAVKTRIESQAGVLRQGQDERAPHDGSQAGVPVLQVPAGAPVRTGPDVSAMSAVEKIKFGLGQGGN